ncbi:hypothetical protein HMI56_007329, partial [Coelomomyces lativittatus]
MHPILEKKLTNEDNISTFVNPSLQSEKKKDPPSQVVQIHSLVLDVNEINTIPEHFDEVIGWIHSGKKKESLCFMKLE